MSRKTESCPECGGRGAHYSRCNALTNLDDTASLLNTLEVLRQRWSHNVSFEATIAACKDEIELCIRKSRGPVCGHPNWIEQGVCPACKEWRETH